MKHHNTLLLRLPLIVFGCILISLPIMAQSTAVAVRNSLIKLNVAGSYKTIQWQVSSDNAVWHDIKDSISNTFTYKVTAPAYVRAKQTADDSTITYSEVSHIVFEPKTILKTIKSSGGQGYAETNGQPASGISIQEDRNSSGTLNLTAYSNGWSNANASLAWYLYHTEGEYDVDIILRITKNATQKYEFSMIDINNTKDTVKSIISVKGTGVNDTLTALNVTVPTTGFYKYLLKPLASPGNNITVAGLLFKSYTSAAADVHATNYRSSPSVHLGGWKSTDNTAVVGQQYDWCYMEILVPEGGDPLYTYYMSLGILSGYMGIQTNSATERRVLFSMWDDGDTDKDPTLDQYKRAGAVDHDPATTVNRFGNEGTGTQSYVTGMVWKTGVPVQFLTNARLEEYDDTLKSVLTNGDSIVHRKNTLVSAWYNADRAIGWKYISTLRLPNKVKYFDSWYSFLENFGPANGQIKRYAYYYNGFAHEFSSDPLKPGRWINFNRVNFSNTDGATGQRGDFEQGRLSENGNYFMMSSGGYANGPKKYSQITLLQQDKTVVDTLELSKFLQRVDEAVLKEKAKNDSIKNIKNNLANKTGWTIDSFSSQETTGEGSVNGRASCTIDGNPLTYWHSVWQSKTPVFPHYIAVDMHKVESVTGFLFTLSGGTTRHMKSIELWGAEDGENFTLMKACDVLDSETIYVSLSQAWKISKFKLVINTSQSGQVHCRINEIDITLTPGTNNTGILPLFQTSSGMKVQIYPNPAANVLNFTLNLDNRQTTVGLFETNGKQVFSNYMGTVKAGEAKQLKVPDTLIEGNYVFQLKSNQTPVYNQIVSIKR
ncbi:MAG: DUF3472 domain-containing protein [Paludibacteraceae bacterium]